MQAGLEIIEARGQLNTRLARERGIHLAVRLGIHTGLVVVGDVGDGTRLHRLKGELLLRRASSTEEVAAWFRQALAVAQHQQAKSLELRAAMSLTRLWERQGKRAAAHALLAPIYGWFTEGFDTTDL